DRGRGGELLGRQSRLQTDRHNDPAVQPDQLTDEFREAFTAAIRPSCIDGHVLAVHVTVVPHSLAKRVEKVLIRGLRLCADEPDARAGGRFLPLSGERRAEQATGHGTEECPPLHYSITSSARARSDGGIVRPSAFAVLRLMTSSNLVGCSTARSPGLAPFRILSTYRAARRNKSA